MGRVLTGIIAWEQKLAIRRSVVLFVTLWMTFRAFEWAAHYATTHSGDALGAAAIIAAVTAPISYLQKVVFEAYISAKEVGNA